ncbi:ATP-binding protein [Streptomyces sp. TS71-3]|uniref:ATP-binding protein n=1 Tax=Streptomyces sp. TS71-3 TaxID=2733862 RepID=UPI001B08693A|nr:ATP-binding protein [Streptomyces sp. TS71-3]GHJ37387.1 hypothetical protein Sm713_29960 [Streptomyces sp. TS71-3]
MTVSATARPTGHPGYTETLPCAPQSARQARQLVRTALAAWGLDRLADDGETIVSELVANAWRHSRCRRIHVSVTRPDAGRVRIGVADASRERPVPRRAAADDVRGRGLALVAALADRWGTDPLPCGKRVWGELVGTQAEGGAGR